MVFVNSSLLMSLGVCSVYDLRYRRIPAIVVAITTLYIAVALGVMGCLTPIRIVGAAVLCTFLELLCIASRDKIGTGCDYDRHDTVGTWDAAEYACSVGDI